MTEEVYDWEQVVFLEHNGCLDKTERLKVPGGYLYRNIVNIVHLQPQVTMTFVPVRTMLFMGKRIENLNEHERQRYEEYCDGKWGRP